MPSQSSNAIEFSFAGGNTIPDHSTLEAIALENGAQVDPDPTEVAVEADTHVATKPVVDSDDEPSTPESKQVASPTDPPDSSPKVYKITVDGQELLVTEKDLLEGHMRNRDYTQKTQRIAAREKEIAAKEAHYHQELGTIDQFLRDKAAIDAYYAKAFGSSPASGNVPAPVIDSNRPLTAQDVTDIARYQASQERLKMEAQQNQQLATLRQQLSDSQLAIQREKVETAIDSHVSALLDKYPVLRKFDGIEEVLMADAQRSGPVTSIDEAKSKLADAAERRSAIFRALADDEKKSAAIAAAKVKSSSPEPPGGKSPSRPAGKKLTLDYKDSKNRIDSGVEFLQGLLHQD